jgi:hypothetical protein
VVAVNFVILEIDALDSPKPEEALPERPRLGHRNGLVVNAMNE